MRPISCKDKMPKIGQSIIYWYRSSGLLTDGNWFWIAGVVDGDDNGLFVNYETDGEDINTNGYWIEVPNIEEIVNEKA